MKANPGIFLAAVAALPLLPVAVNAQAPASIAGTGLLVQVTYGVYPMMSEGYFVFLPANSGNTYQIRGIAGGGIDEAGTYSYTRTGPTNAQLTTSSPGAGSGLISVTFGTATTGRFYYSSSSYPGLYQGGLFNGFTGTAPNSIAGMRFTCSIRDGASPYASTDGFVLQVSASGTSYALIGFGAVENSSGTCSYSVLNRSTGAIQVNDANTGTATIYVGFTSSSTGLYALKSSSGGYQIADFALPDTTPPTVAISTPASSRTYTNAQTVLLAASASDERGVSRVEFYDGSLLRGEDQTAPYNYDWAFAAADNGAHVWRAQAYDAAGNVSTSAPVTLTVSIDVTPPAVAISVPTNGQYVAVSPKTVSGTAADQGYPISGVALVQVRLNGGAWSNAAGTTSWSLPLALVPCVNILEARSRDYAGNYSQVASNFFTYVPPNRAPSPPSNLFPPAGALGVPVTTVLEASPFSDPDCAVDSHLASQWQVLDSTGVTVVVGSGSNTAFRTSWTVPPGKLYYGSNYQWHVRYCDSRQAWSSYSAATRFTTGGPPLAGSTQGLNLLLSWPTNSPGFTLQWSTNLGGISWSNATPAPRVANGQYTVTNNITGKSRFYRLKK